MREAYQKRSTGRRASPAEGEPLQMMLDREELIRQLQQSVHSFGVQVGLIVATKLLGEEVRSKCGDLHERLAHRVGHRYGRQRGVITIAGQKLPVMRPRVRSGEGEVELNTYRLLQRDEAMPEAVLQRVVRGVSTRDYEGVVDLAMSRKVARNVKRWRSGDERRRWCAAGLLVAQSKFRRVKGHR